MDTTSKASLVAYYTILVIILVFVGGTTCLYYRWREQPAIRIRSWHFTLMIVLSNTLILTYQLASAPLKSEIPCWLEVWAYYLTIPLVIPAICARSFQIAAFYCIGQENVERVKKSLQPLPSLEAQRANDAHSPEMRSLSSVGSDATIFQTANGVKPKSSTLFTLVNKPSLQWDSISLSLTDTNEITSFNRGSPVPSLKSTATNASSFNKLAGKFGFRNRRYLTQTMFLSFSIILIITLTLIGLLLVQLVDPHAIGGKMMLDHPSGCLNGPIQWIPFVLPLVPLLFLIYQFIWLLWHIDDIYGIRHEVVVSVCSWIVTAIVSTSWLHFAHYDANSDSVMRVFPPSNLLAINAIVLHITSICWPLWLVRKDRNQLASVNVVSGDVDNIRKDDQLLDESGLHAIYSHITFHEMLQNPEQFSKFKEFTIRHLCVENVLFYEGCCLLLRVAQQHFQRPRSSSRRSETTVIDARSAQASTMIRSPQLQRRLKWFRKMFLSEDAELQVNLSSSVHRNLLDEIKRADAPFDTQPLRAARDEVEELMLRDIYPRYILASEMDMHEQTGIIQCMSIVNDVFIQQKPKKQKKEKEIGLILVL